MKEFRGKVAVVTGAASGIGRALAEHCAGEGMKVVLADIEQDALARVSQELAANGAEVLPVQTDVSQAPAIENLARQTLAAYGAIHLLFNNAGVGTANGYIWENTEADWQWVLGVNMWSVIHATRIFVPLMLEQDSESHIINTASAAGLISFPSAAIYQVSKHAVVSLSEVLYHELALIGAKIKVSVLCPSWVNTRIMESERNRPASLQNNSDQPASSAITNKIIESMHQAVQQGVPPRQIAGQVFEAIRQEKFYILTHPETRGLVKTHLENILWERNPATLGS